MNGQTKVTNRALGDLLHSLIGDYVKLWDLKLSQAEFTHNHVQIVIQVLANFRWPMVVCQGVIDLTTLPNCTRLHGKALDFLKGLQRIQKLTSRCSNQISSYVH